MAGAQLTLVATPGRRVVVRTMVVHPAALSRAFVALPRLASSLEQSERVR